MNEAGPRIYNFDNFRMEVDERVLTRDGATVHLPSKAFDILQTLVENNGRLVTKEALYDRVWADSIVEDANLTVQMSAIRKALGNPDYIKTVKGHGYRFKADVHPGDGAHDGYVIESKTVSRVTIEHETEPPGQKRQLSAPRAQLSGGYRLAIGGISVIVLLGIGVFVWRQVASTDGYKPEVSGFKIGDVKKLTSTGRVGTAAAISPDGKLFAYSQFEADDLEGLWLGHTDGGEPKQLREPAAIKYSSIRFSPNGSHIYYVANDRGPRSLFRIPVFGGAPEKIKENVAFNFSFSPTGDRIAYVRPTTSELVIANLADGSETEIARPPTDSGFARFSPAWSPDGATIAIGSPTREGTRIGEVFVVDIQTREMKALTARKWSGVDGIAWAGSGDQLVVVANEADSRLAQLWRVTFPGGDVEPLTSDLNIYDYAIDASAAGDHLLTIPIQQHSNIWIGQTDALAQAKQVTFSSLGRIDGWSGVEWAANGTIIYTAVVDKISSIWTMAPDASGQRQLTPTGQSSYHPSISDDGRFIVFTSTRSGRSSIWRINSDGSGAVQLTTAEIAAQPHISPDGRWVFYVSDRETFGNLYRIPAEGGDPTRLTDTKACWIRVSPDSKFLAGGFSVGGRSKLGIMSVDGGEILKLFDVPRTANFRLGVRWTPDGKAVTYRDWANGIWKQDLDGGEPTRIAGLPEEKLYSFDWSPDGSKLAFSRGSEIRDVVLIAKEK